MSEKKWSKNDAKVFVLRNLYDRVVITEMGQAVGETRLEKEI